MEKDERGSILLQTKLGNVKDALNMLIDKGINLRQWQRETRHKLGQIVILGYRWQEYCKKSLTPI